MAYDENLARRARAILANQEELTERKMFGGLVFMLRGNMCCGIIGAELMLRVGSAQYIAVLARPHAREMDFTGRPMTGMVMVSTAGLASDASLQEWIRWSLVFVSSLPSK